VTTPKLPPPPLRAQNRSSFSVALTRNQIVDCHPVFAYQPANSTTECQTGNSGLRNDATWDGKTERVSFSVEIAQRCATLHPDYAVMRIYADSPHTREVYNDPLVAESASAHIVSASTYSSQEIVVARKRHRGNDICRSGTLADECWTFVDASIPDPAGTVIARIPGLKDVA
jgi:hypothetical protein